VVKPAHPLTEEAS